METAGNIIESRAVPPIRVGVVEEPELVMLGVDGMLRRHPDRAALTASADYLSPRVDVLLCDPVGRTVDLEGYLDRVFAATAARVLAFTWTTDEATARRVLAAGAHGWLSKASSSADLVAAVEAVHRGEPVAEAEAHRTADPSPTGLSGREREVLGLICRGFSNQEIADELFLSVNSVKTHIRQIYQKIGVARRAQAVAWGLAHPY
ncbi:response regulator transcription factor [Nocardioides sp.]|uniref:response regulator transcription factor n=1 Tax=Nocardioides sp. TaxID=35761 RepID=UPI0031FEB5A3|nr:regulatory protein LuxR [Nocardioides sp.]